MVRAMGMNEDPIGMDDGNGEAYEIDIYIKSIESKDKKIKAIEKQLTDCDDALLKKGIFREETYSLHGTIKELRERLTQIVEAGNVMYSTVSFLADAKDAWKNALSSYDPKWMKARIAEAVMDERCTHTCQYGNGHAKMCTSKAYRQPNQSREKRG